MGNYYRPRNGHKETPQEYRQRKNRIARDHGQPIPYPTHCDLDEPSWFGGLATAGEEIGGIPGAFVGAAVGAWIDIITAKE